MHSLSGDTLRDASLPGESWAARRAREAAERLFGNLTNRRTGIGRFRQPPRIDRPDKPTRCKETKPAVAGGRAFRGTGFKDHARGRSDRNQGGQARRLPGTVCGQIDVPFAGLKNSLFCVAVSRGRIGDASLRWKIGRCCRRGKYLEHIGWDWAVLAQVLPQSGLRDS